MFLQFDNALWLYKKSNGSLLIFCVHICMYNKLLYSCYVYVIMYYTLVCDRLMIRYVSDLDEPEWKGYFYACLMFLTAVVQSLLLHQYFHRAFITGMRIRTAVVAAVYKKVQ